MKFLTFKVCSSEVPPDLVQIMSECAKEFNLPVGTLIRPEIVPHEKNCYYKCLLMKTGLVSPDGRLHFDTFKERLKMFNATENVFDAVDVCAGVKSENLCDYLEEFSKCVSKEI